MLIGAPNYGSTIQTRNAGAVYLYVASSSGLIPTAHTRLKCVERKRAVADLQVELGLGA